MLDSDLKVILASPSFYTVYKVKPEETVGRLIYELGSKQWDIPRLRELLEDILPNESSFDNFEVVHDFNIIGRRTMLLNARQIEQRTDKKKLILLAIEDITKRMLLEELLIDSEERFRRLFETADDGILLLNKDDGNISDINTSVERILGYSKEECVGKNLHKIGVVHDVFDIKEILRALDDQRVIHFNNVMLQTKSGKSVNAELYFVDKASVIQCNIRDITVRNKRAEKAIQFSEKRYQDLFNSIRDAIVVADGTRTIIDCNQAFIDLFGYQKEEVLGKQTLALYEDEEEFRRMGVSIKEHKDDTGFLHITHFQKEGGSVFTGETSVFYMLDAKGAEVGYIGLIRDVTKRLEEGEDRKKLQAQLLQAQKMESIGTLAGGIAHDFNNILTAILGFTELAKSQVKPGSGIGSDLQEVYLAGIRAKDLVAQILAFARQSNEEQSPLEVALLVKEVIKFLRSSIPTTIEVKHSLKSNSLILGNPTMIHQVVMNLATNAIHAMKDEQGILDVNLQDIDITSTNPDLGVDFGLEFGSYIKLKISDNGVGISPEYIKQIFEPYFTTKAQGEGTGLGLSLVHGIVEKYGGKIFVESTLGVGTSFIVYLPIVSKRNLEFSHESELIPMGNERILFVDDEAAIVKMGARMLESLGYEVTSRTSSIEALELFRFKAESFDLVISDITMPNMTGDKLVEKIRAIAPDVPVILCTGYSNRITKETARKYGINGFAFKPIVKTEFANLVRSVLDKPFDIMQ
ncbi:PAS domain-containing hybrid sensor histidine kinase/response regulator [Desulfosediminicola flagellatus]|uniref:PAS domain-containing hybrid sensor histidine kinase/response regulator n=1 Tax=Desulfosediminicola flagellatus TaxID=2569541 RepID=UPI001592F81D|nr:PAS domain-containing sensor histidine kinase [Desulfosediminicola flagellatus]